MAAKMGTKGAKPFGPPKAGGKKAQLFGAAKGSKPSNPPKFNAGVAKKK